jgi:hypothetical protein
MSSWKFVPIPNYYALCLEDMARCGGIASPSFALALDGGEWSVSTPVALPQGKEPQYPFDRLGEPQTQSGQRCNEKNLLPLLGIEPRLSRP